MNINTNTDIVARFKLAVDTMQQARLDMEAATRFYRQTTELVCQLRDYLNSSIKLQTIEADKTLLYTLQAISLCGLSSSEACYKALSELRYAYLPDLIEYLKERGYVFTVEPGREVSGALVKQHWAVHKDGVWLYREAIDKDDPNLV